MQAAKFETVTGRRLDDLRRAEPRYFDAALVLLVCALLTALALVVDDRKFDGVPVWLKPLKFQLGLAIYAVSLAFYARYHTLAFRETRIYRTFTWLVIACIVAETVWITASAGLGKASHYDVSSPAMQILYGLMGVGAAILTSAAAQQAWGIHRNPATGLPPLVKAGIVWGLGLTLPLTLVTAFMLALGEGHHIVEPLESGVRASDAGGLFLFGWSRVHGDLRAAHFFATHAMQCIPLTVLLV